MLKSGLISVLVRSAIAIIVLLYLLIMAMGWIGRALNSGDSIIFLAAKRSGYSLHILDVDHFFSVRLEKNLVSSYAVAPDRQTIAFVGPDATGDGQGIYLMDPYGDNLHVIDHIPYIPGSIFWSPDSTQLAFRESTANALFVLDVRSGGKRQLTDVSNFIGQPVWSPDGKYMAAFTNILRNQTAQIFILSVDDGSVRLLTTLQDNSVSGLDWSADGKSLQFISVRATFLLRNSETYTLYTIDADGNNLQSLSEGEADYGQVIHLHDGKVSFPMVDPTLILSGDISWSDDHQWIGYLADLHSPQLGPDGFIHDTVIVVSRPDGSNEYIFNPHADAILPPISFIQR